MCSFSLCLSRRISVCSSSVWSLRGVVVELILSLSRQFCVYFFLVYNQNRIILSEFMCFQLLSVLLPVFVLLWYLYFQLWLTVLFFAYKSLFQHFWSCPNPLTLLCVWHSFLTKPLSRMNTNWWTVFFFFLLFLSVTMPTVNQNKKQNEPYNYYEYGAINKQTNKKYRQINKKKTNSIRNPFHHTQAILPGIARISIVSAIDCIFLLSTTVLLFFVLSSFL